MRSTYPNVYRCGLRDMIRAPGEGGWLYRKEFSGIVQEREATCGIEVLWRTGLCGSRKLKERRGGRTMGLENEEGRRYLSRSDAAEYLGIS